MRRLATYAVLVLLAAGTACKVVPASPDDPATTGTRDAATAGALGDTTRVPIGKSVTFDGGRFVVAFEAVDADSRCPADAMCVWEGDAEARFRLVADGRRAGTSLHTNGRPNQIEFGGYVIQLVNVEPYPGTYDRSQPASPAVAVIVVRRR